MLESPKNKETYMIGTYPLGTPLPDQLRNKWLAYEIGKSDIILGIGDTPEQALSDATTRSGKDRTTLTVRTHVTVPA